MTRKNLCKTTCECGEHTFTHKDILPPLTTPAKLFKITDANWYGGRVKKISEGKCPKCGKKYLLYLQRSNQHERTKSYFNVIDIELNKTEFSSIESFSEKDMPKPKEDEEQPSLEETHISTLRKICTQKGIAYNIKDTKEKLIERIKNNE